MGYGSQAPIVLVAASGLAREAALAAVAAGRPVRGALDDRAGLHGGAVGDLPVLGGIDSAADHGGAEFVVCAGKGTTRARIVERLAAQGIDDDAYAVIVHPSVDMPPRCRLGRGSVLLAGTVLTADVTVGEHVVAMPNVVLTHDDVVEDYATLCAGVVLGGGVRVGRGAYVGMAASVRETRSIGVESTIGMGSVVLTDVPDHETWAGVPARSLADRS